MARMERSMGQEEVPDDLKLDWINEWFSGDVLSIVESKIWNAVFVDSATTLQSIRDVLQDAYGIEDQVFCVHTVVTQLVKGDPVPKGDFEEMQTFIIDVQIKYDVAKGRGEANTFEREDTYLRILTKKLPHMKDEWLKDCSGGDMSFQTFAKFVRETARRGKKPGLRRVYRKRRADISVQGSRSSRYLCPCQI
jgi:hypothetical protein